MSMLNWRCRVALPAVQSITSLLELKVITPVRLVHVPAPLAVICTFTWERYQPLSPAVPLTIV